MNDFCSVFISQKDTYEALNAIKNSGGDGVVLWGSSSDLNSKYVLVNVFLVFTAIRLPLIMNSSIPMLLDRNVNNFTSTWKTSWARSHNHSSHDTL